VAEWAYVVGGLGLVALLLNRKCRLKLFGFELSNEPPEGDTGNGKRKPRK
jgi:hypothetical protein